MLAEQLKEILTAHQLWRETSGAQGARANLAGANLTDADLTGVKLADAILTGAILTGANLAGAILSEAYLADANLTGANLTDADLTGADLTNVDLTGADLTNVDLARATLADANLARATLAGANLADAILTGANLAGPDGTRVPLRHVRCGGWWMGETGRTLLCVELERVPRFFCGCFRGSEEELRGYIAAGPERLRPSRLRALERCLEDLAWGKQQEAARQI